VQLISQFENLDPLRKEPGKVPLAISLRNAVFDALFYDTLDLSNEEKALILAQSFAYDEGGMLFVYPHQANKTIEYFDKSIKLLEKYPDLDTIAIPGVGSSVIGSAALARQVADITGRPTVGIIAGYGAADMLSEALGGWFDFGLRNRIRVGLSEWQERYVHGPDDATLLEKYGVPSTAFLSSEPESNTLLSIMLRQVPKLKLIVGHSKGALNIHNVLPQFLKETTFEPKDYENLTIVTLGCGVALPSAFRNVHQYVGTQDMLGRLNTPKGARTDPTMHEVKGSAHNLCSTNPFHMPVEKILREALRPH